MGMMEFWKNRGYIGVFNFYKLGGFNYYKEY